MRFLFASLLTLVASSAMAGDGIAQLDWMEGTWSSVIDGTEMSEVWTSPAGGILLGVHRDIGSRKTSFEFLRIVEQGDALVYVAQPGGRPPTEFPLVELSPGKVVFENLEHDFPQRIVYWRKESSLCARIEGPMDGESVTMEWCWEKQKD